MGDSKTNQIIGIVDRIVFRNDKNAWTVLEVSSNGQLITAVGVLPPVAVGETVEMTGSFTEHATFGKQFKIDQIERTLPNETSAILRYLSSGVIKGIGQATAQKIVRKFGADTLKIIENEPERLAKVSGISEAKAKSIHDDFVAMYGLREAMMRLASLGLSPDESMKCWKKWGMSAESMINENLYLLCEDPINMNFERVDALSVLKNMLADDPRRVRAMMLHVLKHNLLNGHVCIPKEKVVQVAADALNLPTEKMEEELLYLVSQKEILQKTLGEREYLFLPDFYKAEKNIAEQIFKKAKIKKRKEEKKDQWISHIEEITGMKYEGKQRQAIETALTQHVMILTGGPGTGKTTTLKAIIHLLREQGDRVLLAAPTGRAAKRMSELTGEEASTIHRLLEVQWDEDDAPYFERNAYNPLEADAVILDEVSMVDSLLFSSFLDALPAQCRLIMVGDTNQLPPVGAGNVLGDLIDSEVVPTIQLNHVFRQALQSQIVTNAHKVVSGQLPEFVGVDSDFFLIPCSDTQATLETILDVCSKRLPAKYGMNIFEGIQVISPGKKGKLGTEDLNTYLQDICNPEDRSKPEWTINGKTFRTGDKVMQMRNNYNIEWFKMDGKQGTGIFNGDIGTIVEIQKRNDFLVVRFDDDREATYSHEDAEDLDLAYAITVHKSQGSEFEIVVLSLFDVPKMLCYRNLFYTAITRAKKLLVIVGNKAIVGQMVQNDKKTKRYSAVKQFILELKGD